MAYVKNNILQLVGNTPLLLLPKLTRAFGCKANIYAKVEGSNPSGSVKDRAALYMIKNALERGTLSRDSTVIAATGGNSAISLAMVCAAYRLDCVIVMPDDTPSARVNAVKLYGAPQAAEPLPPSRRRRLSVSSLEMPMCLTFSSVRMQWTPTATALPLK